jgi:hypothetical protein
MAAMAALLRHGADPDTRNPDGMPIVNTLAAYGHAPELTAMALLLQHGARIDATKAEAAVEARYDDASYDLSDSILGVSGPRVAHLDALGIAAWCNNLEAALMLLGTGRVQRKAKLAALRVALARRHGRLATTLATTSRQARP